MKIEKIKILTIFGTRKELVKLYPVLEKLKADGGFGSTVVTTSQHQEEFDDLFSLFKITPDHDLNIKRSRKYLADITNLSLSGLEPLLKHHQPDLVLVQDESTSAFAGALAAFYNKIPVAHNGAGVRTFNKMEPYPEEVNRRLIDSLSDIFFTADTQHTQYLMYEGAIPNNIFVTGNTIVDSILDISRRKKDTLCKYMSPDDLNTFRTVLVTSNKKENWGKPLNDLCRALIDLTQAYPDIQIAFPLKFSRGVRDTVYKILSDRERIHLLDQLTYEAFVEAMGESQIIVTDSDCIVEEGLVLRKPVLLFREKTESIDNHLTGSVKTIGLKRPDIVIEISRLLENPAASNNLVAEFSSPGDGHAAERIIQAIQHHFGRADRPQDYKPKAQTKVPIINSENSGISANIMQ
jgi:UDP-N-acetylglucosamine 2-epimerase